MADFLKTKVLQFIRKFYNPNLQYLDTLLNDWIKICVVTFTKVLINGSILFFAISGILWFFPTLHERILIYPVYWLFPFSVIYLGIIDLTIKGYFEYIVEKLKGGKK